MQIGGPVGAAELYSSTVRLAAEKTARASLELENKKLAEISETKTRFISTISHGLRTPLTSIIAFTDIIRRNRSNSLSEKDLEYLEVIRRNGDRLKALIDDLLDISGIEADRLGMTRYAFTVQGAIRDLEVSLEPLLSAKGQKLVAFYSEPDIRLISDRDRVEQIISNLVSNASKYSGENQEIRVEASTSSGRVTISVTDYGDGIDEAEFPLLFDEFTRLENEVTRSNKGSGLGLAISRKLARALGGDLSVSSKIGEGSVFTLTLPVEQALAA